MLPPCAPPRPLQAPGDPKLMEPHVGPSSCPAAPPGIRHRGQPRRGEMGEGRNGRRKEWEKEEAPELCHGGSQGWAVETGDCKLLEEGGHQGVKVAPGDPPVPRKPARRPHTHGVSLAFCSWLPELLHPKPASRRPCAQGLSGRCWATPGQAGTLKASRVRSEAPKARCTAGEPTRPLQPHLHPIFWRTHSQCCRTSPG